jgi:methylene-fatty-acyl-phospholipid synthase
VIFFIAAILLSLERIVYIWVARCPESVGEICEGYLHRSLSQPPDAIRRLFYFFKVLQCSTFVGWCYYFGRGSFLFSERPIPVAIGATLVLIGQVLNLGVFYRLGSLGVFYGGRFGYDIPWCREFPFSLFNHPQYVGAVSSIWGFFFAMRFPSRDWYLLPALETVYYSLGAWLES